MIFCDRGFGARRGGFSGGFGGVRVVGVFACFWGFDFGFAFFVFSRFVGRVFGLEGGREEY